MRAHSTPAVAGDHGAGHTSTGDTVHHIRRTAARKWQRVLRALLAGPRTSRELERDPVYDHCAHSTVAELRAKGVDIDTQIVEISGYAGLPARIARYTLTEAGRDRALQLLGHT
jgi:hypothetical protein